MRYKNAEQCLQLSFECSHAVLTIVFHCSHHTLSYTTLLISQMSVSDSGSDSNGNSEVGYGSSTFRNRSDGASSRKTTGKGATVQVHQLLLLHFFIIELQVLDACLRCCLSKLPVSERGHHVRVQ
jgi:hypothetical protein